jgi:hypothetical protein
VSLGARGKAIIAVVQETGFGRLIRRYGEDRADLLVSVVAFNALFSMFPIALGVLAIVGLILRRPDDLAMAQAIVLSVVPANSAASLLQAIDGARQSAGLFGLLSLVGLLWAGSGLFDALEMALDRVYRVPSRSLVRQKLMGLGMMLLLPVYQAISGIPFSHAYYGAIRHAITVGFVSLMIMGIGAKVAATHGTRYAGPLSRLWWPFVLINIGCLLRVSLQVATDWHPVFYRFIGVSGLVEVSALAWWGYGVVWLMHHGWRAAAPGGPAVREAGLEGAVLNGAVQADCAHD